MKNKYKIGDKVDFVNEFGVIFKDKTITGIDTKEEDPRYFIEPCDNPWLSKKEKFLHYKDTYAIKNHDLELNNGSIAMFSHYDFWHNKIYKIKDENRTFDAVLIEFITEEDKRIFYSISTEEEPLSPLRTELQIKKI